MFRHESCHAANLYWSIILAMKDLEDSTGALKFSNMTRREIRVGWNSPAEGWVKCNVDGSSRNNDISAACGGIIRDINGRWLVGFSFDLGFKIRH